MIYCWKQFDVINYVTFCWMTCCFMRLATRQFERKLQKCITILKFSFGDVYFRIYIGNQVLPLHSRVAVKLNIRQYTSPNVNFEYSYPLIIQSSGLEVIKLFSYSTQLSTKFILLINVKMPTIVGILTFISMINTTPERLKARNFFICRHFSFYEQL